MKLNLQLNPISLLHGFESQAYNIQQTYRKPLRKDACLLEAIAAHIRKIGHDCFASSERLVDFYNSAAPRYGVAPISRRTLFNLLDRLEAEGFISRALVHIKGTWVTQRHLLINYDAVERVFGAVLNWAIKAADAAVERKRDKKLHSGGLDEETPNEASADKALAASAKTESCTLITNRSKDKKNKGEPPISFFEKFFKEKAPEVQSLQKAARLGKITASGAKKLIKIHNEYGYPVADKFRKFLNFVIVKGKNKQTPTDPKQITPKSEKTAAKKPPTATFVLPDEHHVKLGLAEHYRDEIGRVHIRWLDKNKIEQAATTTTVSDPETKNFNHRIDAKQPTLNETNVEHGKTVTNLEETATKNPSHAPLTPPDDHHVKLGLAEYYRDEIGRIHVRWLDKDKIEQAAAAIDDESLQTKNESTPIDNSFLHKHLQKIRKLIS